MSVVTLFQMVHQVKSGLLFTLKQLNVGLRKLFFTIFIFRFLVRSVLRVLKGRSRRLISSPHLVVPIFQKCYLKINQVREVPASFSPWLVSFSGPVPKKKTFDRSLWQQRSFPVLEFPPRSKSNRHRGRSHTTKNFTSWTFGGWSQ